jgi:hypothetical protein
MPDVPLPLYSQTVPSFSYQFLLVICLTHSPTNQLTHSPAHCNKSKPKLHYNQRTIGQCVLVSSIHLGPDTTFLLLPDSCRCTDVGHLPWIKNWPVVYNCCWPLPVQSLSSPSPMGLMAIFYCFIFQTPPIWRARYPYLYPSVTGWPSYNPGQWPFSSPPMTCRTTVEVFKPSLAQGWVQQVQVVLRPMVSRPVCPGIGPWSDLYYSRTFAIFMLWGVLPDEQVCNLLVQFAVTLGSKLCRTHDHILLSHLRLPQPGKPGHCIYFPQELGSPVIPHPPPPPGTRFSYQLLNSFPHSECNRSWS